MKHDQEAIEKILKEIVAAYRATQGKPLDTDEHIKHLRYQIARLARVCIEMEKRINHLEEMEELQLGGGPNHLDGHNGKIEEEGVKVTALGDII